MSKEKEILVCRHHPEYMTPLIMTFKFRGAEYWCPYCGETYGMFGDYREVVEDAELKKRYKDFKKMSADFLGSDSVIFNYHQKL